jgi:hypothetical protein
LIDPPTKAQAPSKSRANNDPASVADSDADKDGSFTIANLRLGQDFASAVGVRKLITTIPVRKPSKEWFIRTHPDSEYWLQTAVLELREDRETYLVAPELWPDLAHEATFSPRLLVTSINRQGVLFVWPIRLPGEDGKLDSWNRSAMDLAGRARPQWVRVSPNMSLGAYELSVGSKKMTEPNWPDLGFQEVINIAFRDMQISDWSHPVLQRLRGEV